MKEHWNTTTDRLHTQLGQAKKKWELLRTENMSWTSIWHPVWNRLRSPRVLFTPVLFPPLNTSLHPSFLHIAIHFLFLNLFGNIQMLEGLDKKNKETRTESSKGLEKGSQGRRDVKAEERMGRWDDAYRNLSLSLQGPSHQPGVHPQTLTTNPAHWLAAGCRWGEAGWRLWICMNYKWLIYCWREKGRWWRRGGRRGGRSEWTRAGRHGGERGGSHMGGDWRVGEGEVEEDGREVKSKWWTPRDEEGWSEERWRQGRRGAVSGGFRGH